MAVSRSPHSFLKKNVRTVIVTVKDKDESLAVPNLTKTFPLPPSCRAIDIQSGKTITSNSLRISSMKSLIPIITDQVVRLNKISRIYLSRRPFARNLFVINLKRTIRSWRPALIQTMKLTQLLKPSRSKSRKHQALGPSTSVTSRRLRP